MDPVRIALRAAFAFAFLLLLLRLSGKRTVAQGTPFAFVLALVIGDLVDDVVWADVAISEFVAATAALLGIHAVLSWAATVSERVAQLVDGEPTLLVRDGLVLPDALRRERVDRRTLDELLRNRGLDPKRLKQVQRAALEVDGELSVTHVVSARPVRRRDVQGARRSVGRR
jgi:uncharacterized membrane protein YcaP (DUF421 family)